MRWAVAFLCLLASLFFQHQLYLSWDNAWLLHITQLWLQGANYGHGFIENNPPLILYLYSLPVYLSHLLSLPLSFRLFTTACAIASLLFCQRLQPTSLIPLSIAFFLLPGFDFGQREYFTLLFIAPYLVSLGKKHPHDILTAILASIGFFMKPYFVIPFLLLAVYEYHYWRKTITIIASFGIYVASIVLLFPAYFKLILPLTWRSYGSYAHFSFLSLMNHPPGLELIILWLIAALLTRRLTPSVLASTGFTLAFFLAGKPWYYHALPAFGFTLLALCEVEATRLIKTLTSTAASALLLPLVIWANTLPMLWKANSQSLTNRAIQLVKHSSFYIISTAVSPWPTVALYAQAKFINQLSTNWLLPAALKNPQLAHFLRHINQQNLNQHPEWIGVELPPQAYLIHTIHLRAFLNQQHKQAKQHWQHYRFKQRLGHFTFYRLMKKS